MKLVFTLDEDFRCFQAANYVWLREKKNGKQVLGKTGENIDKN